MDQARRCPGPPPYSARASCAPCNAYFSRQPGELERINAEAADAQYNAAEAAELFRRMEAVVEKEVNKAAAMADEIKAVEYQVRPGAESNTQYSASALETTRGLNAMGKGAIYRETHWDSPDTSFPDDADVAAPMELGRCASTRRSPSRRSSGFTRRSRSPSTTATPSRARSRRPTTDGRSRSTCARSCRCPYIGPAHTSTLAHAPAHAHTHTRAHASATCSPANARANVWAPANVQDCEEDVGEAFDAYAKAGHAASVAKRKAERLGMQLRWMRQEEGLLRQTQTTQIC